MQNFPDLSPTEASRDFHLSASAWSKQFHIHSDLHFWSLVFRTRSTCCISTPSPSPRCSKTPKAKRAREEAESVNIKRKTSQEVAERTLWNLARKRAEGFDKNLKIQLACEGLRVEVKRLKTLAQAEAAKGSPA